MLSLSHHRQNNKITTTTITVTWLSVMKYSPVIGDYSEMITGWSGSGVGEEISGPSIPSGVMSNMENTFKLVRNSRNWFSRYI